MCYKIHPNQVSTWKQRTVDGPADADAEAAWAAEIDRRVEAIETGTVKLESWEQVKRRIAGEVLGR